MRINEIKAEYKLQAAKDLRIEVSIDYDGSELLGYSLNPGDGKYGVICRFVAKDCRGGNVYQWEYPIDFRASLHYGILDELIGNTIQKWAKGHLGDDYLSGRGGYNEDDPEVVWLLYKLPFMRVVTGDSVDLEYTAELTGMTKDGTKTRVVFNNIDGPWRKVTIYRGDEEPEDVSFPAARLKSFDNVIRMIEEGYHNETVEENGKTITKLVPGRK